MTYDMWTTLGILAIAIVLFVTEWLRVDVVAIAVMVTLMLSGLLTTGEALSGFSNSAVLTIAALFIVGGAVMQTGLADLIGRRILSIAGTSEVRLIAVIMGAVALLSGFMSDAGTVAVLLPAIVSLAGSAALNPSRLLIPLAFGALLGGATTLIGTPPNLIVSNLLREEGLAAFTFFDYTPIGVILLVGGLLFMLSIGRLLLPDRKRVQDVQRVETAEEPVDLYRMAFASPVASAAQLLAGASPIGQKALHSLDPACSTEASYQGFEIGFSETKDHQWSATSCRTLVAR